MGDFGDFIENSSTSLPVRSNFKTFLDNSKAVLLSLVVLVVDVEPDFFLETLTSTSRWLTALLLAAAAATAADKLLSEDIFLLLWVLAALAVAVEIVDRVVDAADVEAADVAEVFEVGDNMDAVVVLADVERCSIATILNFYIYGGLASLW